MKNNKLGRGLIYQTRNNDNNQTGNNDNHNKLNQITAGMINHAPTEWVKNLNDF
ncbi:MAG: hypothetical protein KKG91_04005 [Candidatus Omnitrophica bacterium]|nr:hypothetical protein [Candidatus Omnitrophota bacterium]